MTDDIRARLAAATRDDWKPGTELSSGEALAYQDAWREFTHHAPTDIATLLRDLGAANQRIAALREALSLANSMILSGESHTPQSVRIIQAALAAERRSTVERIRARLATLLYDDDALDGVLAILDAEAER